MSNLARAPGPPRGIARLARLLPLRRRAPGPPFGTPEWEQILDITTRSGGRDGNRARLLLDGVASFAERRRLIEAAERSVCLQTYIFTDDETGWDVAHQLEAAAGRGVAVRVIYDALGSSGTDAGFFEHLRRAGVEVREYGDPLGDPFKLNNRWHEKHLVVDGRAAIEGGMNIADEYAFGGTDRLARRRPPGRQQGWRDADILLEGPVVRDIQAAFLRAWAELGEPVSEAAAAALLQASAPVGVAGGVRARFVEHRPEEDHDENTRNLYVAAIRSADRRILIETAYFVPPPILRAELQAAARRGVKVRVMTNSTTTDDVGLVAEASTAHYPELLRAGVRIVERTTTTLHSKTAAFDGVLAIVGSANLNGRSEYLDAEDAVAIADAALARALERRFGEGLRETRRVTRARIRARDWWTRLKRWFLRRIERNL